MTQHLGNVFKVELKPEGYKSLEDDRIVPTATHHIANLKGVDVGVWQADPGLIGGQTNEEIFIVLEGRAEVTFEDTKETIQIGPGDVVRLRAGQRNRWRTIERLRKISVWIDTKGQAPTA
jgi:uncharacterized cupin superfamily protein